jgi:hypothetical protein
MVKQKCEVLIPDGMKPKKNEISAAWILAEHYVVTVKFLRPLNTFMRKTPNFDVGGMECELKTPESSQTKKVIEFEK